jgi:hypothetical protein
MARVSTRSGYRQVTDTTSRGAKAQEPAVARSSSASPSTSSTDGVRLATLIEGMFGPAARDTRVVSAARQAEGKWREAAPCKAA